MNTLDISVVIPCFNADNTIRRCLDSVLNQTALPREIILVDDGSDVSVEQKIVNLHFDTPVPIRVIRQCNMGAPAARNTGVQASRCRYIAFLDADDVWFPEKLRLQYHMMESHSLVISGHGYTFNCTNVNVLKTSVCITQIHLVRLSKWRFSYGNPFFTPTVMVLRSMFSGFDERFLRADDYKAWVESFIENRTGYIEIKLAGGFKPPIGHSGLTASVSQMHTSYVNVLNALLKDGNITIAFFVAAILIEFFKYPIRCFCVRKALQA